MLIEHLLWCHEDFVCIEALVYKGRSSRNYGSFIIINLGLSSLKNSQR